jgi:hypothetical protein
MPETGNPPTICPVDGHPCKIVLCRINKLEMCLVEAKALAEQFKGHQLHTQARQYEFTDSDAKKVLEYCRLLDLPLPAFVETIQHYMDTRDQN